MASKPSPYAFPLKVREYAAAPIPSMEEWKTMWKAWDCVTTQMIPPEALMEQPISLRNPLKFYVGHIPTFEDIHLSRATGKPLTEPCSYAQFFERGIDPDVDDPTQCHDHSELPTVWPELDEMLEYREKVKLRIKSLYDSGVAYRDRCVGRALWIGYEHEGLHLETFLYMSLLSPNIKPPPGVPRPKFEKMARLAALQRVPNQWFTIPEQELTIGYEDPESDHGPERYFAWDNEREPYDVRVPGFEAQARPVSVGEYAAYLVNSARQQDRVPVTWVARLDAAGEDVQAAAAAADDDDDDDDDNYAIKPLDGLLYAEPDGPLDGPRVVRGSHAPPLLNGHTNGNTNGHTNSPPDALASFISQHSIRTVWGPIPLAQALDWPAMLSYNEASSYAAWVGGGVRIPTMHEVRSIHELVDTHKKNKKKRKVRPTMTATATAAASKTGLLNSKNKHMHTDPEAIFTDLTGANVGLQHFHPVPVTHRGAELCGLGDLGGAWEWTSSLFAPQPNFKPMDIYRGYSYDFMDDKHMAITGGSWALPPRISGRKTFQNWWQKGYLYPWVAVRLVRDLPS